MSANGPGVSFLYGTAPGRALLDAVQKTRAERVFVAFLRSGLSRPLIPYFARKHRIPIEPGSRYVSFRDFFARTRDDLPTDQTPEHLVSPCDGWLSVFPIEENSSFAIKQSRYRVSDLIEDAALAERFRGGTCMVLRLCATDYHHYSYIDDGSQGENHFIPGVLHSVQPIACDTFPVFMLNRRCWCRMDTAHFGTVIQTEIGALVVGGIVNHHENCTFKRGEVEMALLLSGSTITLLFERDRVKLRPELERALRVCDEVRVEQGMWIGCGLQA